MGGEGLMLVSVCKVTAARLTHSLFGDWVGKRSLLLRALPPVHRVVAAEWGLSPGCFCPQAARTSTPGCLW